MQANTNTEGQDGARAGEQMETQVGEAKAVTTSGDTPRPGPGEPRGRSL